MMLGNLEDEVSLMFVCVGYEVVVLKLFVEIVVVRKYS